MCLTPIRIPTNKVLFDPSYDRLYNIVPCGKCSQCLEDKRFSYEVRCYYEYIKCKERNGVSLYVTFTYNEDNVPYITVNGIKIRVFDKTHVQKFLDALRKRIKRKYGVNLSYLWCSEYGGKTHRPHYHSILNVDGKISHNKLRKWIKQLWKYGFVKFGDNFGVINRPDGIAYCCKYVTKDTDFYKEHDSVIQDLRLTPEFAELKNKIFPFHLQSAGLGIKFLGTLTISNILSGTFNHMTKKGPKEMPIPLYYTRKLLYTHDKRGCYSLTEFGAQVMAFRQKNADAQYIKKVNSLSMSINNLVTDDMCKYLFHSVGLEFTKSDIVDNIKKFRDLYSDAEIIDYKNNFRYFTRFRLNFPDNDLENVPYPIEERYSTRYKLYDRYLDARSDKTCISNMDKRTRLSLEKFMFNHICDIEPYMVLFDTIMIYLGKLESDTWFINETNFKKLKNKFAE